MEHQAGKQVPKALVLCRSKTLCMQFLGVTVQAEAKSPKLGGRMELQPSQDQSHGPMMLL